VAHWQGVAAAACEQCGRNQVPLVAPLEKLEHWLARPANGALAADAGARCRANAGRSAAGRKDVQLLIGAEGGLDPQEMQPARQAGFQAVRLGRASCARKRRGLAALAAMQVLVG
jgi:16S rRNA (uracil1498-N3)-methyltransferase